MTWDVVKSCNFNCNKDNVSHINNGLYLKDIGRVILNQSVFNSEYILMSIKFPLDFSYCLRVPSNVK